MDEGRQFGRIAWLSGLAALVLGAIGSLADRTTPVALGMFCLGLTMVCVVLVGMVSGRLRHRGVVYEAHRDRTSFGCLATSWAGAGGLLMLYAAAILLGLVDFSPEDARAIVRFWGRE